MQILFCFLVTVYGLCLAEGNSLQEEIYSNQFLEYQQEVGDDIDYQFGSGQQARIVIGRLWNNLRNSNGFHTVPYRIDRSVYGQPEARNVLSRSILLYGEKTCIRFVKYSPILHRDYITFIFRPYQRCFYQVGRQGGNQPVYFNLKCSRYLPLFILRTLGVGKAYKDFTQEYTEEDILSLNFKSKSPYNLTPMAVAALLKAYKCFGASTTAIPGTTIAPLVCGKPVVKPQIMMPKIIGGKEAIPGSHPWQVSIRLKKYDRHICGGILIGPLWILSATHCFIDFGMDAAIYNGYVGKHHLKRKDVDELQLWKPVEMSDKIKIVCLPTSTLDVPDPNTMLIVSGWGETFDTGDNSVLRQVRVPLMRSVLCKRLYPKVRKGQICAGYEKGGQDSCWGDSGGPLVVEKEPGIFSLVGIVSWGKGCGAAGKPGVYTDVAFYINWITATTTDE